MSSRNDFSREENTKSLNLSIKSSKDVQKKKKNLQKKCITLATRGEHLQEELKQVEKEYFEALRELEIVDHALLIQVSKKQEEIQRQYQLNQTELLYQHQKMELKQLKNPSHLLGYLNSNDYPLSREAPPTLCDSRNDYRPSREAPPTLCDSRNDYRPSREVPPALCGSRHPVLCSPQPLALCDGPFSNGYDLAPTIESDVLPFEELWKQFHELTKKMDLYTILAQGMIHVENLRTIFNYYPNEVNEALQKGAIHPKYDVCFQ